MRRSDSARPTHGDKNSLRRAPLQRTPMEEAVRILPRHRRHQLYDTASAYTDSEIKIGAALSGVRHDT